MIHEYFDITSSPSELQELSTLSCDYCPKFQSHITMEMKMSTVFHPALPLPPEDAQEFPGVVFSPETLAALLPAHPPLTQAELDERHLRTLLQPPHPELDQAIDDGDAARVQDELDACRHRFHTDANLNTALVRAVTSGRIGIIRLLSDNGIPIITENLETAARSGNISVLAYLMEHFHWPVDKVFDNGLTILTLAIQHADVVLWLLSKGASVDKEDGFSETPLSRAVQAGTQDVIKVLLDAGADVARGTPLQASLLRREGDANLQVTRLLLELGAPVDKFAGENSLIWETAGFEQMTALHVACDGSHHNLAAVRLLLEYGADPTLNRRLHGVELPNTSALDSATGRGYTDIASILREHVSKDRSTSRMLIA